MTTSEPGGPPRIGGSAPGRHPRQVVVVDDHELLRAGTRRILDDASGFTVTGEAADGMTALSVVDSLLPDVVLVDIRLPTINGIELARRIVASHPDMVVIILSAYDDEDYVRAALTAGVSGYLLKTTPSPDLISAIEEACTGATVLDRALPPGHGGGDPKADGTARTALTAREQEVVGLAARGLANKAIAKHLGISSRTVEGHLNHIFEKLGTTSRTELVHYALTSGLLRATDARPEDAIP